MKDRKVLDQLWRGFFLLFTTCAILLPFGGQVIVSASAGADFGQPLQRDRTDRVIKNTKGVVVLGQYQKSDFVRFYNRDGTLWYEFSYFYDDANGKFEYANHDFRPFAFHQDHFLLVLKCTDINEKFFEVIVNEETGLRKYVKANDPVFKFETWQRLVLSTFAVNFETKTNPVLEAPAGQTREDFWGKDITLRPIEIRGDWLRIEWQTTPRSTNNNNATGWVRWKQDGNLLIELYFFA